MTSLLDGMARSPGPGEVVLLGGCWWMRGLVYPAVNVGGRRLCSWEGSQLGAIDLGAATGCPRMPLRRRSIWL